ncbi:hypothetical protein H2508_04550 [Parahaliea sp. F7430]|uniref:Uncharacterized protein n=1 Tax=Sediminihaliea albiluteola TaxID=2758564 RepID=A0A7W2TUY9_9GAMM|nr:hypothetical protein [Sediminihaliea albiluteola]MBA6412376.1 hypothetical protein [Sediminihaliea albiluteola]
MIDRQSIHDSVYTAVSLTLKASRDMAKHPELDNFAKSVANDIHKRFNPSDDVAQLLESAAPDGSRQRTSAAHTAVSGLSRILENMGVNERRALIPPTPKLQELLGLDDECHVANYHAAIDEWIQLTFAISEAMGERAERKPNKNTITVQFEPLVELMAWRWTKCFNKIPSGAENSVFNNVIQAILSAAPFDKTITPSSVKAILKRIDLPTLKTRG